MTDRDLVRELRQRLSKPVEVARKLGLKVEHDGGRYALVRCPVHAEKNASCSLHLRGDTLAVKCWGCEWTGDLMTLIAAVVGLDTGGDFREVLAHGLEIAGMSAEADEVRGGRKAPVRQARPLPEPEPERDYPPGADVRMLWSACIPAAEDIEARAMLEGRRIDPVAVTQSGAARALHPETHFSSVPSWARFKGRQPTARSWIHTGHRLLLPVYDATGLMRSVRAWLVNGDTGLPKRVPPSGYRASALVLANSRAVRWLRGETSPSSIVVVEGEPDFLVRTLAFPHETVVGIGSGSWTDGFAERVPYGAQVSLLTHLDSAGDRYAEAIEKTLRERAQVFRWTLKETSEEAA